MMARFYLGKYGIYSTEIFDYRIENVFVDIDKEPMYITLFLN